MWTADHWKDYELIDCSRGEKLERWGEHLLVRPDPQAIWNTPRVNRGWKHPDARYARSNTGGGQWASKNVPERWQVRYGDLTLNVGLMNFKHTGIFPEQAANWDFAMEQIRTAGRPIRVLNLFAYTGGATVACAKAGASVCHVDAAKGMVAWAKDNLAASGLAGAPVRFIVDDVMKFVLREQRRGRTYHGILMDPPSYGRGPNGEMWKIEDNLYPLVEECVKLLDGEARFFLINSYTTGLAPSVLSNVLKCSLGKRGGKIESDEVGLPITRGGMVLPCGASGRWEI